jgi:hypothetical protein
VIADTVRVLGPAGALILADEFRVARFEALSDGLPMRLADHGERELDMGWQRPVAERAIDLYAAGWVAQSRHTDPVMQDETRRQIQARMAEEMERQLATRGTHVPFGPVRLVVAYRMEVGNDMTA